VIISNKNLKPIEEKKPKVVIRSPKQLDLDMTLAEDGPTPLKTKDMEPVQLKSMQTVQVAAIDMNMEIVKGRHTGGPSRVVATAAPSKRPGIVSSQSGGYLSVPMDIAPEASTAKGVSQGKNLGAKMGSSGVLLSTRTRAASLDHVSMTLEIPKKQQGLSGTGGHSLAKGEHRSTRLLALNTKCVGGVDLPPGLIGGEGTGKESGKVASPSTQCSPPPVRIIERRAVGQIALGTPLAFRLADVEEETRSGSAYLSRSTQLKRFLDYHRLPDTPVTVSIGDGIRNEQGTGNLIAVSYSNTTIILQFANGKQQVITLVPGEPYPRFELRLASNGSQRLPVGTKLEEITVCLQTLQNIFKE
jgi:hypothetical protein